jgi:outer membrane biosynthesis protein TonB
MAAGKQMIGWEGPSRRRVPRYLVQAPLDVMVLRSGVPDKVPGRSMNVGERGIAAVIAGELIPGETVGVEITLSPGTQPLRTRATVKYQHELRCGLEFAAMTAEQRAAIRDWAREAKVGVEVSAAPPPVFAIKTSEVEKGQQAPPSRPSSKSPATRGRVWLVALLLIGIAALAYWWRWNHSWQELESGLKISVTAAADRPSAQVPAEVMEKLLVHRVEPVYPTEARKENLQGIIALDIVVGRDGAVMSMHPLNGPDVLARAAMDALRWWKFEPYRVNGEAVVVESRVAVEFKR